MVRTNLLVLLAISCLALPIVAQDGPSPGSERNTLAGQAAEARLVEARAMETLVDRSGCLGCHSLSDDKIGPSLSSIATRYTDGPSPSDLQLVIVPSSAALPEKLNSKVVIAQIGEQYHIRIFDSQGKTIVDKATHELVQGPALDSLTNQFRELHVFNAINNPRVERLSQVTREVMQAAQASIEDRLFQVIKFGGKGNWTSISKGAPMPPHSARLTDVEIRRLIRWLLATTRLKVMKTGLGTGKVTSPDGLNCGGDCEKVFTGGETITLTAQEDAGSVFVGWEGDVSGVSKTVNVTMDASRSVRARFDLAAPIPQLNDFTPEGIRDFLTANPVVNSPSRFIAALPDDFKQNWLLMTRSESLQTGTADSPRILLPSADATAVFTIGMKEHTSYPGSHPSAVEYMQWDAVEKNFRFHEIVLADIPPKTPFPLRSRGVSIDDSKCSKCHSTRNVLNRSLDPGTTGVKPPFTIKAKNKPNWDTYDSWGGLMPFNRDRIYKGSVEAAAFRQLLNPWTWSGQPESRAIIEQLQLQPPGIPLQDEIGRTVGGTYDGHVNFKFDDGTPVLTEPVPVGSSPDVNSNYLFNRTTGGATPVIRGGVFITLHHSLNPLGDEGRAVDLFDRLGGADSTFNAQRIADELINHSHATGSIEIDVRPIALAISQGLIVRSGDTVLSKVPGKPLTIDLDFFKVRCGMAVDQVAADTGERMKSMPRRKADLQKLNLDRSGDIYLLPLGPGESGLGLLEKYGSATNGGPYTAMDLSRIRQEVFRRPVDSGAGDQTIMGGIFVDRESHSFNEQFLTLYRYFLEPLGVSVDRWSMGVRGRSRTYTFADVFGNYLNILIGDLRKDLEDNPRATGLPKSFTDGQLIDAVNLTLSVGKLPEKSGPPAIPRFTDLQRIFNKSCIECHGGLEYPPYAIYSPPASSSFHLDFSEDENPPAIPSISPRLARSHNRASTFASTILARISMTSEACPFGLMPCGGPRLSQVDIETFRRWKDGGSMFTVGDPHIQTVDGTSYDFQADGEFVFLRGENLEIQVRQTAVNTGIPLGPNEHSGLTTCVSINTAVALRVGSHRVTYQPDLSGRPNPEKLDLRIDGEIVSLNENGISLGPDGRIMPTLAPGGLQIETVGKAAIVITPGFWEHYQVWFLNIAGVQVRETEGLMGLIAPGNWLPAMPDGTWLGPRPEGIQERYDVLYHKFGDAWRVTDTSSLFDYAPGTSTATFTLSNWPNGIAANDCKPPVRPQPLPGKEPLKPISREAAEEICMGIKDDKIRAFAVQDVMVTGDPIFGKIAMQTDMLRQNVRPAEPLLEFPEDNQKDVDPAVTFTWNSSKDGENKALSYRHYVWPIDQVPDDNQAHSLGRSSALKLTRLAPQLEPGRSYYWKVIVEDGRGGVSESVIRKFTVKK